MSSSCWIMDICSISLGMLWEQVGHLKSRGKSRAVANSFPSVQQYFRIYWGRQYGSLDTQRQNIRVSEDLRATLCWHMLCLSMQCFKRAEVLLYPYVPQDVGQSWDKCATDLKISRSKFNFILQEPQLLQFQSV